MSKDTQNPALSKSLFLAELAQQRLFQTAQQVEREIKHASDQDAAKDCLSILFAILRAEQDIIKSVASVRGASV